MCRRDICRHMQNPIGSEVLAPDVKCGHLAGYAKEWNINGEAVTMGVEKERTNNMNAS